MRHFRRFLYNFVKKLHRMKWTVNAENEWRDTAPMIEILPVLSFVYGYSKSKFTEHRFSLGAHFAWLGFSITLYGVSK